MNGGALIGVPGLAATTPLVLANGTGTWVAANVSAASNNNPAATNVANILAAPQNFYFNVHTTQNGGGVMRGQLQ